MEDAISLAENTASKMGATNNNNLARIAVLQERKKQIEETLAKRTQELRQLCIQEAELTGLAPPEMPLEPGEPLPNIRRRVGTSYQLPDSIVKSINNNETIADIELQFHWHATMAQAALGLSNENNLSKTMKRQHRNEFHKHKNQCTILKEKLDILKDKSGTEQQHKQKKKQPRVPDLVDDSVSVNKNINEPFLKSDVRHSMRSMKHAVPIPNDRTVDHRHYRNSDVTCLDGYQLATEDLLTSGIYRLSLNGYTKYLERRENTSSMYQPQSYTQYNLGHSTLQHNLHYQQTSPHVMQYSPQMSQHSPQLMQQTLYSSQYNQSQQSPQSSQHSPSYSHMSQQNLIVSQQSPQQNVQYQSPQQSFNYLHYNNDYNKYNLGSSPSGYFSNTQLHRQSSPTSHSIKTPYYAHTIHGQPSHRQYQNEFVYRNSHQIQPHQQYEQMPVAGLGGCWKQNENGELVWCNANTIDASWQRDKRFGSLDRRKNKRVSKRISPNIDSKSATLATVPNYQDQVRSASVKSSQLISRRSQDNGQLVRTQSLGSVGALTVDSVYPSDDNSSCGSEHRLCGHHGYMNQTLRKNKEKEWLETSLDGPVSPTHSIMSSSQPLASSILTPDEKYVVNSSLQHIPPPLTPKPALEIPAESNPSPRVPETNMELFNNNVIPKNCTIVQAGHCKPYHEETKPFEMSDFYKYSTKFKKSPSKSEGDANKHQSSGNNVARHLERNFEENATVRNSPQQFYNDSTSNASAIGSPGSNINASFELEQVAVSEHFSAEMNAWYKDQQQQNNNTGTTTKTRSATLV